MRILLLLGISLFFLINIGIAVFHIGGQSHEFVRNIFFNLGQLVPILGGIYSARLFGLKSITGKSLALITLGIFLATLGALLYTINEYIVGRVEYPSIADIFILLGYPLILAGLIVEIRSGKVRLLGKDKIFFILVGLILSFFVFYFAILRSYNPEALLTENIVTILYGIMDIVLIISVVLVINLVLDYAGGKLVYPWIVFFIGTIILITGDILFNIKIIEYQEKVDNWHYYIDLIWLAAYLVIGYGLILLGAVVKNIQVDILKKTSLPKK